MKKIVFLFIMIFICSISFSEEAASSFEVHYLDVGQGNAEFIICDGHVLMIDGGPRSSNQLIFSYLRNTLQIEYIDYIISTHPDADHISGIASALVACDAGIVYSPVLEHDTKTFQSVVKYADERGIDIVIPEQDLQFPLGSATVQILGPVFLYDESNKKSLVTKVTYGETSFLFMGDADKEVELDLISAGYDLGADVLLIGHHGSNTATGYQFLYHVDPQFAVISVGADNSYGHPNEGVLDRLNNMHANVLRTDLDGHIICRSDGTNLTFETSKKRKVQ